MGVERLHPMSLFKRHLKDSEIDEELRAHVNMAIEARIARGQSPEDARRAALLEFGNLRATYEDVRSVWTWTAVEQLLADMRSGFQILTRSPGISLTAIALIALVIGGNTTIFSIVHGLLTKPAPAITAHDLVSLGWAVDRQPVHPVESYANYLDVASQAYTVRPLLGFQFERRQVPFALPAPAELAVMGAVSVLSCCAAGLLGAVLPAWRAGRRDPYDLVRGEGE